MSPNIRHIADTVIANGKATVDIHTMHNCSAPLIPAEAFQTIAGVGMVELMQLQLSPYSPNQFCKCTTDRHRRAPPLLTLKQQRRWTSTLLHRFLNTSGGSRQPCSQHRRHQARDPSVASCPVLHMHPIASPDGHRCRVDGNGGRLLLLRFANKTYQRCRR